MREARVSRCRKLAVVSGMQQDRNDVRCVDATHATAR